MKIRSIVDRLLCFCCCAGCVPGFQARILHPQVVPIYGRGADQTDPRKKSGKDAGSNDSTAPAVPRRPLGQRPAPVNVKLNPGFAFCLCSQPLRTRRAQATSADARFRMQRHPPLQMPAPGTVQPSLNIIPTLFGLNPGSGIS